MVDPPNRRRPPSAGDAPDSGERYGLARLMSRRSLPQLATTGAVVACVAAAFAFTAGWISPERLTQARIINRFERIDGPHPGFRRNHAKGVCFTGWFDSDGAGQALSKAEVFKPERTPVFGRFALAGGQPYKADGPKAVRSMAVDFQLRNGEVWRTGMNDIPVFPVKDVRGFYDQLAASRPDPRTGAPAPQRMKAFLQDHPEAVRAMAIIKAKPFSSGFADASYNSLNAFRFVDGNGRVTPVRWSMVAEDAFRPDMPTANQTQDGTYLFDDLAARVRQGLVRWRLVATLAQPGDPTNDATRPWPADRRRVQLGELTIDGLEDEAHGACRDITFDPLILPAGIAGSDDPLLSARSATYATSLQRRDGEAKTASAVQVEGAR